MMKQFVPAESLHSQKGRGLLALMKHRDEDTMQCVVIPGDARIPVIMAVLAQYQSVSGKLFVRPCPEVPNHGADVAGFQSEPVDPSALVPHLWKVRRAVVQQNIKSDIAIMP